ncbi:MAG: acetyltransferase N-acetylglutamate synthase [Nitrospirae bacterium]|nr:MAG: acetyltransferase N-acetylglutamate synthase [Nitrospirota bacterium]
MSENKDMAMKLEHANEQDLESILLLQKKAFLGQALIYNDFNLPPLTQTIDDLKNEFRQKAIFKVEQGGRIVASIRCCIKDNVLYLEKLIVDPDFQNRGIGTKIMTEIEKRYASSVNRFALFTGHKSGKNLHIYNKLGYKKIRRETIRDDLKLIYMEKAND